MTLINDHNRRRDPSNDARVVIPNIDVATTASSATLGQPTPTAPQRPSDGGKTAGELMQEPIIPLAGVTNAAPGTGPASGFDTVVENANNQIRSEFNWRRNALTGLDPVPLYESRAANPWTSSVGIVTPRLDMNPAPPSESLRRNLAAITGVDLPRVAQRNAFGQTNLINSNRDGARPDRLGDMMQRLGFRRDNVLTRGIANLAGVGGAAANITDMVTDATIGPLFDQTLGRVIYGGDAQNSYDTRMARRERDFLQPARELGAMMLTPQPGESPFGVYGSGLPGAINMASDYVPNLVTATGLSAWRGARTITSALRGEEYSYNWDEPVWNALNPLSNDEVYSFFEDPEYSPVSVRRFMPEELGEDASTAERISRRVGVVALGTLGFLLDGGRPDIDTLSDFGRWAQRGSGAAARNIADAVPVPVAPTRRALVGTPYPDVLPGTGPNQPRLPGGDLNPFDPGAGPELDLTPRVPVPVQPSGSIGAQIDYETLFISPDGVALEMPRNIVQTVDDTLSRAQSRPSVLNQPFPEAPGRPLVDVDAEQLADADARRVEAEGAAIDELGESRLNADRAQLEELFNSTRNEAGEIDPARAQDALNQVELPDELDVELRQAIDSGDMDAVNNIVQRELDQFDADLSATSGRLDEAAEGAGGLGQQADELAGEASLEELVARADEIEAPQPLRQPGAAEAVIRQAVDTGELEVRPSGFVRADDAVQEAQKQLISTRIELDNLNRIPATFRNAAERARFTELTDRFNTLRTEIAGRTSRSMASQVDQAMPVVTQRTLTPPANPAKLYQWSRNLPPGQRIYLDGVEFDSRSARDLTEIAKFFGHADVARSRVLSADMIANLRQTYGSLYSNFGPPIDSDALKRLNVEGVGRVEVDAADAVTGQAQTTRVYSDDVVRTFDESIKRAEEFGNPTRFTQTQLSEMATDEIQSLLDTQFSSKAVYAQGGRNASLARTRAELMDELRFRDGEDMTPATRAAAEPEEIEDYLDALGEDIDPADLDDEAFNRLAEDAALNAERKAEVPVREVQETLPDDMKPESPRGEAAIKEMVAAEQGVGDAMQPVRELVEIIETMERQLSIDGRRLDGARLPQNLNTGVYDEASNWKTRQMSVDEIADRTVRELEVITPVGSSPKSRYPSASMGIDEASEITADRSVAFGERVSVDLTLDDVPTADPLGRERGISLSFMIDGDYSETRRVGGIPREMVEARRWMKDLVDRHSDKVAFLGSPSGRNPEEVFKKYEMYYDAGFRAIDFETAEFVDLGGKLTREQYGELADLEQGPMRSDLTQGLEMIHIPAKGVDPMEGKITKFGAMPEAGVAAQTLDGRRGTLTGSRIGSGADAKWEVRLEDGTVIEVAPTEVFPPDAAVVRPDPAASKLWYLGTRADIDMTQYNGVYDSTMHSPLGPGTYLVSDPKMAEDAARAFVPQDAVGNYPIASSGSVSTVGARVNNVMSADSPLMSMEEVWVGTRNLIKEFFDDPKDVKNVTTAARRKNLAELYDYLARKLDDDVRLFDFESRMSVFLHSQGVDAIVKDGPDGTSLMNVIKPNSLDVGDTTKLGADRAVEQMAASTNYDGGIANMFGTRSAQDIAAHSHYRFGLQMRDRFVGFLQDASERVNKALERLDRADARLEEVTAVDAQARALREAESAAEQLKKYSDETPDNLGCL